MKRGMICPDCGMDDWDYIAVWMTGITSQTWMETMSIMNADIVVISKIMERHG